jgi:hypothetical protein
MNPDDPSSQLSQGHIYPPQTSTHRPETPPPPYSQSFWAAHRKALLATAGTIGGVMVLTSIGLLAKYLHKSSKKRTLFEALEGQANAKFVEHSLGDHDFYK